MKTRNSANFVLLMLASLLAGCETSKESSITGRLWGDNDLAGYREPAASPNLKLFDQSDHRDVLVQYDEESERNEKIQRRAYFLLAEDERVNSRKQPRFVSPDGAAGLQPIILGTSLATNLVSSAPVCALVSTNNKSFTLFRDEHRVGAFYLPVYRDREGLAVRIFLTPLAVAMDGTVVAVVAGVIAWYAIAHGSGSTTN